jgi:hypothetical protein
MKVRFRKNAHQFLFKCFRDPFCGLMRIITWREHDMSYDPLKKSEYQFRLVASVVIFAMLIYVITTHGLRGPALFEVGLFGGAFATLTFCHSIWALWKIRTQGRD